MKHYCINCGEEFNPLQFFMDDEPEFDTCKACRIKDGSGTRTFRVLSPKSCEWGHIGKVDENNVFRCSECSYAYKIK